MKPLSLIIPAALLTACASTTVVTPLGQEQYMVGFSQMGGMRNWTEVKISAIEQATAFCAAKGDKPVEVIKTEETGARGWSPMNVEVTFRCGPKP